MSIVQVKVPELSESVSEANLLEWKKSPGEPVVADEILVEIETDKIVLEIPAPANGVLASIEQPNGAAVLSDQLIATIDTEAMPSQKTQPVKLEEPKVETVPVVEEKREEKKQPQVQAVSMAAPAFGEKVMPAAAVALANAGIASSSVQGTGPGGRITKADALKAVDRIPKRETQRRASPTVTSGPLEQRPEQRVPMSRLRARVAERLVQSQSNAALLTTFNEVDLSAVIKLRNSYKESFEERFGVKLGFMSFFVKAAIQALKQYPIINASVEGNDIIYHGYMDIGIAVGSPRGLVVPVLRDADQMTFAEIEKAIADFASRAKEGKLALEELIGGTFTISNGGVFGSLFSTPIVNPPQSAILGIHATKPRAVVVDGQIVARPMNYFALSYDHRIIDGREAVLALVAIKNALEDPARLLLDL